MKAWGKVMMNETMNGTMSPGMRRALIALLALVCLSLAGCSGNIGVGLSVGVPVGDHGYMSIGSGRWY